MATTLANYRTYLEEDWLRDPSYRIWGQTVVERAINRGYIRVQQDLGIGDRYAEASTTFSTVAGTASYALPTGYVAITTLEYAGTTLAHTDRETIARVDGATTSSGIPSAYYTSGASYVYLRPTPNAIATVSMLYTYTQAILTSGVDSALSTVVDSAVVAYAAYTLLLPIDQVKAKAARVAYDEYIQKCMFTLMYEGEATFESSRRLPMNSAKSL